MACDTERVRPGMEPRYLYSLISARLVAVPAPKIPILDVSSNDCQSKEHEFPGAPTGSITRQWSPCFSPETRCGGNE